MPIGWPSAIAPPLTLTIAGSTPSWFVDGDADRRERLVDFDQVEVGDGHVRLAERVVDRVRRLGVQRVVRTGHVAVRADLGQPGEAQFLGLRLAHDDDRGGTVRDRR